MLLLLLWNQTFILVSSSDDFWVLCVNLNNSLFYEMKWWYAGEVSVRAALDMKFMMSIDPHIVRRQRLKTPSVHVCVDKTPLQFHWEIHMEYADFIIQAVQITVWLSE